MFHLIGFYENVDQGGVLQPIAGVNDETLFVNGDDVRVPLDLPYILGAIGDVPDITVTPRTQLISPSLRRLAPIDLGHVNELGYFDDITDFHITPNNPFPVQGDEPFNFQTLSNPAAAIDIHGLVWFCDGPQAPVNGEVMTVRATAAVVSADGSWTNGPLSFDTDLPIGNYTVVGMRANGVATMAARLNFVGGVWRPGVMTMTGPNDQAPSIFRMGRLGVWGSFHTNTPPSIDVLGGVGTTQEVFLDLIPG